MLLHEIWSPRQLFRATKNWHTWLSFDFFLKRLLCDFSSASPNIVRWATDVYWVHPRNTRCVVRRLEYHFWKILRDPFFVVFFMFWVPSAHSKIPRKIIWDSYFPFPGPGKIWKPNSDIFGLGGYVWEHRTLTKIFSEFRTLLQAKDNIFLMIEAVNKI